MTNFKTFYLGEEITNVVITLLEVLDAATGEVFTVPAIVDDDKTKIKPFTEFK